MRETILGNNIRKVPSVAVGCIMLRWNRAHISLITLISTVAV